MHLKLEVTVNENHPSPAKRKYVRLREKTYLSLSISQTHRRLRSLRGTSCSQLYFFFVCLFVCIHVCFLFRAAIDAGIWDSRGGGNTRERQLQKKKQRGTWTYRICCYIMSYELIAKAKREERREREGGREREREPMLIIVLSLFFFGGVFCLIFFLMGWYTMKILPFLAYNGEVEWEGGYRETGLQERESERERERERVEEGVWRVEEEGVGRSKPRPQNLPHHRPLPSSRLHLPSWTSRVFSAFQREK